MVFKIKKILTDRQLRRAKWSTGFATALVLIQFGIAYVMSEGAIEWNGQKWETMDVEEYDRGRIVYFSKNTQVCSSSLLIPGIATLNRGFLAFAYGFALIYLFLGIAIVAEIFMEAIEKITSKKVIVNVKQGEGNIIQKKVTFWNPTVANLTLMALGSSAPEILLAVLETVTRLGKCPGELGASTIVGSASFNLLVISGLSIYAVSPETDTNDDRDEEMPLGVKRIKDMRVFAITCTSSIWAYIWVWICLMDQYVNQAEAWITFIQFFILIIFAYLADRSSQAKEEKDAGDAPPIIEYSPYEIYKDLLVEQQGKAPQDEESIAKRERMKKFLRETMNTDQIDRISLDELKQKVEGDGMISRIKYRKNMMTNKKPVVGKYEKMKLEHAHAEHLDESEKNDDFGFQCLHYSVSEASEKLTIVVLNKKKTAGKVKVKTIDGDALAGEDYEAYENVIEFKQGEAKQTFDVVIFDDEDWEPDEDFYVQLYDPYTQQELPGKDTKTRVTIIDDDKPGQICFKDSKGIKVSPTKPTCDIVILRKNGSDGVVKVDYTTVPLGDSDHTATDGVDYRSKSGTLVFNHGETEKTINIEILQHEDENEMRDESFGLQLSNCQPAGAKLSKKSFQIVNVVTDLEQKKKSDAYAQLIAKIEAEEEKTWGSQFITACMLHPSKNDEGDIEDIEAIDGLMHFLTIGWKLFFSLIPPAHMQGGIPCFFISLAFIGFVTFIVGEFANLFGCVLGIKPGVTAITFVALGTSLPDTFASMTAAQQEAYADAAVGNVTGSNSVNVFLGLGLPWVIAATYEAQSTRTFPDGSKSNGVYYVPASSLGFSVVVFVFCAVLCVICLLVRRKVVKGELGGESGGRLGSLIFLVSLWLLYIIMSIIQAYEIGGTDFWSKLTFGIDKADYYCAKGNSG